MNTPIALSRLTNLLILLTLILSLAACGTLEMGIERTPGPTPIPVRLDSPSTQVAPTPAPPASPQWRLLYRLAAEGQLWLAAPDGSQPRLVAELPDITASRTLGSRYLAYVLDARLYVLDPATGETHEVMDFAEWRMDRGLDVNLCWSRGGETLVYAAAHEKDDGSRRVELGRVDGYNQREIIIIQARPPGPTPTPPPLPPAPPEPGFATLLLLGYDILADTLVAVPVGEQEHYSAVWVMRARNGDRLKTIPLYDSEQIVALALSPGATRLAVARAGSEGAPARLELYSLAGESTTPETYNLPFQGYAMDLRWSPDGESLAFLVNAGAPGLEATPTAALWVMQASDHSFRQVLELESPEARLVGWAPEPAGHLLVTWLEGLTQETRYQLVDVATSVVTDLPLPATAEVLGWVQVLEAEAVSIPAPTPEAFSSEGTQVYRGKGFSLRYPANAQVEHLTTEPPALDAVRIVGPEVFIKPGAEDWSYRGWAYEVTVALYDNPEGLDAESWARNRILTSWQQAKERGEPIMGPPVSEDGRIREQDVGSTIVAGYPAFWANFMGGDSDRRIFYLSNGHRIATLSFDDYPLANQPLALVQQDIHTLIMSTFRFEED